ncbi:hypothetical protein GCM10027047_06360 [Rhodococcus aerolatus]
MSGRVVAAPRVAVVDDHDVVHAGLEAWLGEAGVDVVARARDHAQALALTASGDVDVVVLDLLLDEATPDVELLSALVAAGLRVVVHSSLTSRAVILDCLERGAATYLVKNEGREHLVAAVTEVAADRPYIAPTMAGAMAAPPERNDPGLSPREVEVLLAWFRTESKILVGQALHIAPGTINTHLGRARAKYAAVGRPASTKSALLARAIQDGLIDPDEL